MSDQRTHIDRAPHDAPDPAGLPPAATTELATTERPKTEPTQTELAKAAMTKTELSKTERAKAELVKTATAKAEQTWTEILRGRVAAATGARSQLTACLDLADWLADADPRAAADMAVGLVQSAEALGDPLLVARAYRVWGHALLFTDPRRAYDELAQARRRYIALRRAVGVAWCDLFTGIALEYLGDPGGATVHAERALAGFRPAGELAGEARALNTLGVGQAIMGHDAECLALFQRSAELAERAGDPVSLCLGRLNAAEARGRIGVRAADEGRADAEAEFEAALGGLRAVHVMAVRAGFTGLEPWALAFQVVPLLRLGRVGEAVTVSEQAVQRAGCLDLDDAAAPALHHAGIARLAAGDLDLAAEHLRRALALYEQWELTHVTVELLRLLVEVEEERGDLAAAFTVHKRLLVAVLRHRDAMAERDGQIVAARFEAEREMRTADRGRRELQLLARTNRRLAGERRAMERLALTDPLTGLANRRHFDAQFARLLVHAELTGAAVSLVLIDIDHFKRVNDLHSHVVGDGVLRHVAAEMARQSRTSDLTARIGGEEFAVLLPATGLAEAGAMAERLRESVAALDLGQLAPGLRVTVSAGVAGSPEQPAGSSASTRSAGPQELMAAADSALYEAKRGGRNRVCGA